MSSGRSLRGGIFTVKLLIRKSRSARNFPVDNRLIEVAVGCGYDPDVDFDFLCSAHSEERLGLENAK